MADMLMGEDEADEPDLDEAPRGLAGIGERHDFLPDLQVALTVAHADQDGLALAEPVALDAAAPEIAFPPLPPVPGGFRLRHSHLPRLRRRRKRLWLTPPLS